MYTIVYRYVISFSFFTLLSFGVAKAQTPAPWNDPKKLTATILQLDSLFWQAYNTCDIDKMSTFFTDHIEFYHDKGGLTSGKTVFIESVRTGL